LADYAVGLTELCLLEKCFRVRKKDFALVGGLRRHLSLR
jgi:hypothetical protein